MRAVLQRVSEASVSVAGEAVGEIGPGILVLLGISPADGVREVEWLVDKVSTLRIFNDDEGKMNLSLADIGGAVLLVSQFTLYGDARKGRRPSFVRAASGPEAEAVYEDTIARFRSLGIACETGRFGAKMEVSLVNEGPVTILIDSDKTF